MSVETALQAMRHSPQFIECVVSRTEMPARAACCAPLPASLDPRLGATLAALGLDALYVHQSEAVGAALRGDHVAVVTPAASGKTLCYNLPTLHRLLADPSARALYLFPTKALAQDQLAELSRLIAAVPNEVEAGLSAGVYDGDTPSAQRPRIRDAARIVLSNPDMLHAGILPQHTRWAAFFASLRVVVIDEMHVYRGVFGSHVANVLRRLRRICAFYGAQPQFLLASATIANPDALATRLVEAPVTLIGPERNGAPQGRREVVFYNPPLLDADLGIRRSSSLEAADLAAHLLAHDVQTIVFALTRLGVELTLTHVRDRAGVADSRRETVRGYRGGYLPLERRTIEKGLREGRVRCVVTTNALELGVDIGRLDAAILVGYPGSIASTRQQMGRAGRRQGASIDMFVAGASAVDQYIVRHPEYVLAGNPERALVNPDNPIILASHLACAAAELPFSPAERFGTAVGVSELLADLAAAGQLYFGRERYYWSDAGSPAGFSLRSASPDRVVIQAGGENNTPRVIGEVDRFSVPMFLYEGAVYLHEGASYLVEKLDWEAGIASVRPQEVDFYTRPIIGEHVEVVAQKASLDEPGADGAGLYHRAWGDVRVISQATEYRILRRNTNEVLGLGPIDLPEQVLETQGCWLRFEPDLIEKLRADGAWLSDPNDYGPRWGARREAIRARDGYRCRACGAPEPPGRPHDVHHRIPLRAFLARPELRPGLSPDEAWKAANQPDNLVTLCAACHHRAESSVRIHTSLGGVASLLAGVAPLLLMCDPRDLGRTAEARTDVSDQPTITIFEHIPGGVGYAEQIYTHVPELLVAALELVTRCPCASGCPSCVGPVLEHAYALETKALAAAVLQRLAGSSTWDR